MSLHYNLISQRKSLSRLRFYGEAIFRKGQGPATLKRGAIRQRYAQYRWKGGINVESFQTMFPDGIRQFRAAVCHVAARVFRTKVVVVFGLVPSVVAQQRTDNHIPILLCRDVAREQCLPLLQDGFIGILLIINYMLNILGISVQKETNMFGHILSDKSPFIGKG